MDADRYRLYSVWATMKQRCSNPRHAKFLWYGAKGITVCVEWVESFQCFYKWALQNGYKQGLSIDRIESNGNYSPENCRWIPMRENIMRVSRKGGMHPRAKLTIDSVIHIRQRVMRVVDYAELYGVNRCTISTIQHDYSRWTTAMPR